MKKIAVILLLACGVNLLATGKGNAVYANAADKDEDSQYETVMKQDLLCLFMAYPEYIVDVERKLDNKVYVKMKSGRTILYDDKKSKTANEKLANTDLQDMLEQSYPLKPISKLMEKDFDPGRFRVYELLREVYGDSRAKVETKLASVRVGYSNYQFNSANNGAASLKNAVQEITTVIQKKGSIGGFVFPANGTYNYRIISGTSRLSPHAFGIAIDLTRDKRDYWKWASMEEGQKRLDSYPKELVQVFENNGFIWGGKWNHFDILHFEYRPEIILKAKYFGGCCKDRNLWYEGVPLEEGKTKDYIDRIENALKGKTL